MWLIAVVSSPPCVACGDHTESLEKPVDGDIQENSPRRSDSARSTWRKIIERLSHITRAGSNLTIRRVGRRFVIVAGEISEKEIENEIAKATPLVNWLDKALSAADAHWPRVLDLLEESERLLALGFSEVALVRAVTALELFTQRILLDSFYEPGMAKQEMRRIFGPRGRVIRLKEVLNQQGVVVGPAAGQSPREAFDSLAPDEMIILGEGDDTYDYRSLWNDLDTICKARNKIMHEGTSLSRQDAERHIATVNRAVRQLLLMIRD